MNLKRIFLLFIVMFFLTAPLFVSMAQPTVLGQTCEEDSVCKAIVKIKEYVQMLGGVVVAMMVIIGGFLYATGGGNEKQLSTAKSMITAAVIGMIIILASEIIVNTVKRLLDFS